MNNKQFIEKLLRDMVGVVFNDEEAETLIAEIKHRNRRVDPLNVKKDHEQLERLTKEVYQLKNELIDEDEE